MWYLCVFYHRLLDYRKPEVESLAELFGAFSNSESESVRENGNPEKNGLQWRLPQHHHPDSPFHFVNLPSDDIARKVANRSRWQVATTGTFSRLLQRMGNTFRWLSSVGEEGEDAAKHCYGMVRVLHSKESIKHLSWLNLTGILRQIVGKVFDCLGSALEYTLNCCILVKGIYELWGEGHTYEELEEAIKAYPDERKLPYLASESTFRITVDSFGKVMSFEEQKERIQSFSYIPFKGRVNLKNPDHKFWVLETDDYGSNNGLPPVVQKGLFFGREVGTADRKLLPTYQLKSRTYLGPTAMDAEMAFLMANQALVAPGKLVYDPFVGTGSILVAAAHFGAMTMGADIDIRVVRDGRGPNCNVWSNFKQYGLPMPLGLLRADNNLPPWRPGLKEVFDAIICDPPYGVRAGGRKSGGRKLLKGVVGPYTVPDDKRTDHIPSTAGYCLAECVHDLLDLAAQMLVMGGRLVFFYPVLREDDTIDTNFPEHPCFKLVAACEQILSLRYSRVLLTMVKIGPYTEEIAESARIQHLGFKENHLKWLEHGNLRSAVFSPFDSQPGGEGYSKLGKDSKPKYRGKYV